MNSKPNITIIMPVYNRDSLVQASINSVLAQTYSNWELIIIDDASTDNTFQVISEIAECDDRIKVFAQKASDNGAPACRNMGLNLAEAERVMFLDSDDILAPWCIKERMTMVKKHHETDLLIFDALEFTNTIDETFRLRSIQGLKNPLEGFLNFKSCWQTSCVLWRKRAIQSIGGWKESAMMWQDGEVHIRALAQGCSFKWMHTLPDVFIRVHFDEHRISQKVQTAARLINLTETYYSLFHHLNQKDKALQFEENAAHMIFNLTEMMSYSEAKKYLYWLETYEWKYPFLNELKAYVGLLRPFKSYKFFFKIIYQIRKVGIPLKRKIFLTHSPLISKKELAALRAKIKNHATDHLPIELFEDNQ